MKKFTTLIFAAALGGAMVVAATPTKADQLFNQGFETDTSGWFSAGGTITRVASGGGTLAVASSSGGYHAEVTIPTWGVFTRFGGYSDTWPTGGFEQNLDVYIDPAAGNLGDGWWLDNAITCSDEARTDGIGVCSPSEGWLEAGGIGAFKKDCGGGTPGWAIAADGDGAGNLGGGGVCIITAGWYTIVSEWIENAGNTGDPNTDGIDRNTYVVDSGGNIIYTSLNPNQHLLKYAGGWRYGWLSTGYGSNFAGTLAIDNSILEVEPLFTPVAIDIKPGSDPNSINSDGKGVIPVAILTTSVADGDDTDFDALTVDPYTLELDGMDVAVRGKDKIMCHVEDVDSDGDDDLVCQFEDEDSFLDEGSGIATVTGETFGGDPIEGSDSINIVP